MIFLPYSPAWDNSHTGTGANSSKTVMVNSFILTATYSSLATETKKVIWRLLEKLFLGLKKSSQEGLVCVLSCFSCVLLFVTLWTVAHQVPLFMGFSKQEYWSRLGCHAPLQGIFLTQGLNLCLLRLLHCRQFFTTEPPGRPFALIMAIDGCEVHNCCPHLATSLMTEKPRVKRTIGKQGSTTILTQLSVLYLGFQLCNVVYKFKVEDSNS